MILYACVASAAGERILVEHEHDGTATPLFPLAAQCLRAAPRFHALYTHTTRGRIYAFLMNPETQKQVPRNQEDEDTYSLVFFAIADEALGREKTFLFLRRLCQSYCKCRNRKGFDISQVLKEVAGTTMRTGLAQAALPRDFDLGNGGGESVGGEKEGDRRKDGEEDPCSSQDGHEMEIDVAADCNRDSRHHPRPPFSKRLMEKIWWQHVRVVILLDLVICFIMLGIWLTVCRGFQCIASN